MKLVWSGIAAQLNAQMRKIDCRRINSVMLMHLNVILESLVTDHNQELIWVLAKLYTRLTCASRMYLFSMATKSLSDFTADIGHIQLVGSIAFVVTDSEALYEVLKHLWDNGSIDLTSLSQCLWSDCLLVGSLHGLFLNFRILECCAVKIGGCQQKSQDAQTDCATSQLFRMSHPSIHQANVQA